MCVSCDVIPIQIVVVALEAELKRLTTNEEQKSA